MSLRHFSSGLSRRAHVVGTIHSPVTLEAALRLRSDVVDFFEIRIDAMLEHLDRIETALQRLKAPVIVTVRHFAEGGAVKLTPGRRRELFERFLPQAALIDVELRAVEQMAPVIAAASGRVGVILSHHDFQTTPTRARLEDLARRAMHAGATVFKVASVTDTPAEVAVLLSFMARQKRIPLSVMGMGKYGRASRLLLAQAGSVLNYGYLGAAAAVPGQWPAEELRRRMEELT